MLWRARAVTGWVDSKDSRQRLFREEADQLLADVRRLQPQTDELLGNDLASSYLQKWVPDIVMNLRSGAAGSGGGLCSKSRAG